MSSRLGNSKASLDWKELVLLGENLLAAAQSDQKAILQQTAEIILDCKVELYLSEKPIHKTRSKKAASSMKGKEEIPSLLLLSIEKQAVVGENLADSPSIPIVIRNKNKKGGGKINFSKVAVPLQFQTTLLGAIQFNQTDGKTFTLEEIEFMESLGRQAALSIQSSRQIQIDRRQLDLFASVSEVSNAITSILDEDDLLNQVANLIYDRYNDELVQLYSVHSGRGKIFFRAGKSANDSMIHDADFSYELADKHGIIPWVARNGKTYLANDLSTDKLFRHPDPTIIVSKSEIAVPLKFGGQVLGILDIQSSETGAFGERDQRLLEAIGDYIAISMHNASLYRSEQWRRQVAESMREVAGLLTANADLNQVLQHILHELEQSLPIDIAAIWFLEQRNNRDNSANNSLRLAAVHLSEAFAEENANNENRFNSDEILQYCQESQLPSLWLMEALDQPEPLIRKSKDPYDPLGAILDFNPGYSAIAAPLRLGNEVIGLLSLAHHTNGRYGHESQNMTATFASYAAVAIENTRLYEAAHDQAWISTILLQVAEATQALNSLDELLTTMAQLTPTLLGMNSCSIFLWDNFREVFIPSKSFGLESEQENQFMTWLISLGDIPVFDQMYFSKMPVYFTTTKDTDHPLAEAVSSVAYYPDQLIVLFPMVTRGDLVGAFMITYRPGVDPGQTNPGRLSREIDWEEKYAIIQGITQQTAVAVENMQLLRAQQEEAYVSVALLQVAQAVVSLTALDQIIETIVRLTPILIGVKRCAIFLWYEEDHCYRLADSFGLSRGDIEEMGDEFLECEFPLLDEIRQSNKLAIHLIQYETEGPLAWQFIQSKDFNLFGPEVETNAEEQDKPISLVPELEHSFLHSSKSLMFGYPLSVKGKFIGVMLTQETDPSVSNLQGRSKRHEISIGITQQVAMAVQNDQLQREVLVRERLEREFQLALDIQKTFLPGQLPTMKGWELNALWRPAREVSGDFYDIIELSDGRLGIIIADVADKGMPAALFMTLIRTLARAAAREFDSPAQVLSRVNDLLIPDTKNGMFVTVAYLVLDTHNGTVHYANAGHNPPLLVCGEDRSFRRLTRTGMALGIVEGSPIEDNFLVIEPGDLMLLYTDGVTESFSPEEVMFGEASLIELVTHQNESSASQILDLILSTVTDFIGGTNYSDDITMVAIRREPD